MIETVLARRSWSAYQIVVVAVIAAAWLILIIAPATPYAALVDHAQIEAHDVPPALRWAAFLTGWTLMAVAMMLPGNLAAMRSIVAVVETRARAAGRPLLSFVLGYLAAWTLFGAALYAGDTLLHEAAENGVVGEAVERLIPVAVLTVAGLYQFSPLREHCRRKRCGVPFTAGGSQVSAGPFGVREGLLCVGSCGSPMFVMFALGGGLNLIWMAAITAYTLAERTKGGKQLAPALGAILLLWAGLRLIL